MFTNKDISFLFVLNSYMTTIIWKSCLVMWLDNYKLKITVVKYLVNVYRYGLRLKYVYYTHTIHNYSFFFLVAFKPPYLNTKCDLIKLS